MATRTKTVTYYSCDICGTDYDEEDLARVYDPQRSGKRAEVDICYVCKQRPIADLLECIAKLEAETAPVRLRGVGVSAKR